MSCERGGKIFNDARKLSLLQWRDGCSKLAFQRRNGEPTIVTKNAQPEENGKSKAGIVLQAAGGGSRGRALAFQPTAQLLVDFGRNLHSIFLDS